MEETQGACPRRTKARTILILFGLYISAYLAALDAGIVTTALPIIATTFGFSDSGYAWVASAYLLSNAASLPFWGKLSEIFGRKRIIITANVVFLAGSTISARSTSLPMLLAGRAVQGVGGGGVLILVSICVTDMFSIRERSRYLGILGAVWSFASATGPVLGGMFTQELTWRWAFYINLAVDGACLIVITFLLDLYSPWITLFEGLRSVDWLGIVTITGATTMLLLGLQLGGVLYPWNSARVICLLLFSGIIYGIFILTQYLSPSPIVPLSIFSHPSNLSALAVCFFDAFVINSIVYTMPLYFQAVLRQTPLQSGILMLAFAIPLSTTSACSGWIMERTGRFLEMLRLGLVLITLGVGLFISLPPYIDYGKIIPYLIIPGIGFGPNFHAPLLALQTKLKDEDVALGTATFGFVRMLSGAMGIVFGQIAYQSRMHEHIKELVNAGIEERLIQAMEKGSTISGSIAIGGLSATQIGVVRGAMIDSLRRAWILYTVTSFVGLLTSLGITKTKLVDNNRATIEE